MIAEIQNKYLARFDELNVLGAEIMTQKSVKEAEYFFDDILIDAYIEGFRGAQYILGGNIESPIPGDKLMAAVNKKYDGISIQEKLANYYNEVEQEALNRLLEDEYHRAYNQGQMDGAEAVQQTLERLKEENPMSAISTQIFKTWITAGDEKVRKDHQKLDGVTIPIFERFVVGEDSALAPGGFKSARLNVNCRCMLDFAY